MSTTVNNSPSSQIPVASYTLENGTQIKLQILEDPSTGKKRVSCDLCGTPVTFPADRSWRYLDSHRESYKCFQAKSHLQVNQADLQQTMTERLEQGVQGSSKPFIEVFKLFLSPSFTMFNLQLHICLDNLQNSTSPVFSPQLPQLLDMSHLLLVLLDIIL